MPDASSRSENVVLSRGGSIVTFHSRIFAFVLLLPLGSHVLAAGGSFGIVPTLVSSFYEYCAYPLCNPARGSIDGEFDDGKTIDFIRNENASWVIKITGFSSNPGNYFDAAEAWCDGVVPYQELIPYSFSYNTNTGVLTVELESRNPTDPTCWEWAAGPSAPYTVVVWDY
jgi:hypothetical protein